MDILGTIALIILFFWIVGVFFHIAGALINILLLVGIAMLIYRFFSRSR